MTTLTRRQSLIVVTGGVVVVGALGLGLHASDEAKFIRSVIERVVGPFEMDEADFSKFVTELETKRGRVGDAKFAAYRAFSLAGPDVLIQLGASGMRQRLDGYERKVVTKFLTSTDYLQIDARVKNVSLTSSTACASPFARFDFA